MIEIFYITFVILCLLYVTGFGVGSLFLPTSFKEDIIWLSPWIGTVFVTVLSVYMSMMGIPMKYASVVITAMSTLIFLYALYKRRMSIKVSKELIVLTILTCGIFIFNIYPLFKTGFPTIVSLGNLDPLAYINPSDFLVNHGVFGNTFDTSLFPGRASLADVLNYSYRWGSVLIISFFSSMLSMPSYKIYSILLTIYFALTFPLVYVLAKVIGDIAKKDRFIVICMTFLTYGFNATLLYILYNVFFGQILFDGLLIFSLLFFAKYLLVSTDLEIKKLNRYDVAAGILLSAGITIYPDGLIMLYVPLIGTGILSYILSRQIITLSKITKTIMISILVNPFIFYMATKWAYRLFHLTTTDQKIGWEPIRYSFPHEFLGFYNLHYYRDLPLPFDILFLAIFIVIFVLGFIKLKQKLFISMYTLLFLGFLSIFRFLSPNFFVYHRTVTYALFLFSIFFAIGISVILSRFNKKIVTAAFLILLIFISMRSAYRTLYQMIYHMRVVDRSLISLEELNSPKKFNNPIITSDIFSSQYDPWIRLWREYFLRDIQLVTLTNIGQNKKYIHDDSMFLMEKVPAYIGSPAFPMYDIVWENSYYKLGKICRSDDCLTQRTEDFSYIDFKNSSYQDVLLDTGWDAREEGHRWISSSEATLRLLKKDKKPLLLQLNVRSMKEPQRMKVYVNKVLVNFIDLTEAYRIYTLPLRELSSQRIYTIKFVFDHQYIPAEIGLNDDQRTLSADFQEVRIK